MDDPGFDLARGVAIDPDREAIYVAGRRSLNGTEDVRVARFTP